jgi:very-short-patch-repair endonuclease
MDNKFLYQNKTLKERRKELRNNQTEVEKMLWSKLKNSQLGFKFTRQYSAGPYILDFYCPKLRLGIELDGSVHLGEEAGAYDKDREQYLKSIDIAIIRFWNSEVESDAEMVLNKILAQCSKMGRPS